MSQWGSKQLADEGYDAVAILRYYYGDDIYLENAVKVSGVPKSYPGEPLQNGSTGDSVRTVQTQLNSVASRYSAIPKLIVDGIYGDNTTEAVEVFQGIFNLPQSGIVDFSTWYQLSQIYVAIEKLAEL
jgi:peptidoglycan hydrolase-like protein with peptidoglycan-binding domain